MGCSQSKDQVLHTSHVAAKSSGKSTVKDDKKIAVEKEMVKHASNERKEEVKAMEEEKEEVHESEDEPFYSADDEEIDHKNEYDRNAKGALCHEPSMATF